MLDLRDDYLTPSQAAAVLGISSKRIQMICDTGELKCVRTPLGRLISRAVVLNAAAGRGIRVAE
jgi:excisionase family DNA binding protein